MGVLPPDRGIPITVLFMPKLLRIVGDGKIKTVFTRRTYHCISRVIVNIL